ncbi:hypothetical protein F4677DRAFT_462571 [Hypoxylon crocopeplum]|nr:hypothetical protein F4677DRAFT_462571 [Hypoxylon crocopeplum]
MDWLDALESMAQVAIQQPQQPDETSDDDIRRWQSLFRYTYAQATQKIQEHRSDLSRVLVTDSHWEIVRVEKEAQGYDKEAYEHSCSLTAHTTPAVPRKNPSKATKPSTYLLKLEGPLSDVELVKSAVRLHETPIELNGTDDSGEPATFCKVDAATKEKLLEYLSDQGSRFQPTFHSTSIPVWYFFYGTLGNPEVLKRLLGCEPSYHPATLTGGVLKTWAGKYKALVDAFDDRAEVAGQAFLVYNKEQEETLQLYETDKYEVVRCDIRIQGKEMVQGAHVSVHWQFRFLIRPTATSGTTLLPDSFCPVEIASVTMRIIIFGGVLSARDYNLSGGDPGSRRATDEDDRLALEYSA